MRVVVLGPPSAGKGTQAARLAERYGVPHLSTGDALRAAASGATGIGSTVAATMRAGRLVPDETLNEIVAARIDQPDAARGFILDGYPRTVEQAEAFAAMLARRGLTLDAVVELRVDDPTLVQRMEKRAADAVASGGTPRADDNHASFRERLHEYREKTAPLSDYYAARGELHVVDAAGDIASVTHDIVAKLGGLNPSERQS